MLFAFIIYYLFGKYSLILFTIISFVVTIIIFNATVKFYFPRMENRECQNFHEKYPEFMRKDLNQISFGRIFLGLLSFLIIKFGITFLIGIITKQLLRYFLFKLANIINIKSLHQ